ncbi:hypothetical protein PROVRETT_08670 [Providencia rettgeri DSM 1131]|nr:hypothetical protein PROVRETT_08670 [Providencia rettgeri DSM 1131]
MRKAAWYGVTVIILCHAGGFFRQRPHSMVGCSQGKAQRKQQVGILGNPSRQKLQTP